MLLSNSKLLVKFTGDVWMVFQVFVSLSLSLVVLEALGKEKNTLKCEDLLASITEIVAAHSYFALKLRSIFSVERSLFI